MAESESKGGPVTELKIEESGGHPAVETGTAPAAVDVEDKPIKKPDWYDHHSLLEAVVDCSDMGWGKWFLKDPPRGRLQSFHRSNRIGRAKLSAFLDAKNAKPLDEKQTAAAIDEDVDSELRMFSTYIERIEGLPDGVDIQPSPDITVWRKNYDVIPSKVIARVGEGVVYFMTDQKFEEPTEGQQEGNA